MKLTLEDLKLIRASLRAFDDTARSDEPHWAHTEHFINFQHKVHVEIQKRENRSGEGAPSHTVRKDTW